ncbi:hypothetical protein [Streptomyces sp. NPDC101165]|uniref:hypothetical protein n=1 Tax=Streptomyces sp. NPDC101165 TaxID=3366119 RepID=UPI0037F56D22
MLPGEETGTPLERVTVMAANVAKSLVRVPDFRTWTRRTRTPYETAVRMADGSGRRA